MARILVVEDQQSAQKLAESILQSKGHSVTCVPSPLDAFEVLREYPIDLIITDVMMPGGVNGFDFTKTVRGMEKYAKVPVIIVTGRREIKDVEKGIQSGADDYVIKPIDPDILVAKVDSLLSKAPAKDNDFMSLTIATSATWDTNLQVIKISEMGMTLRSDLPAQISSKLRIKSEIFEEIGIPAPALRVVGCEAAKESSVPAFNIDLHFIGLNEKSLQPLRLWIRQRLMKKSA
ncbi:MAG: response regulator [Bdellovibrionaceae bacterium]|nr:response regulator [Pseudobdellovibrionaceae bacterium]